MTNSLQCEMTNDCHEAVAMIDRKGYVYCAFHGVRRRATQACRRLTEAELLRLDHGLAVKAY